MSKKKHEPASLGEVVSGTTVSVEGLERLASQHHSVRYVLDVLKQLQARPYATCALIRGEPGTGKEGLALTLHELMQGQDAPLVTISTAGRPEDDVAAELFGTAPHKKGDRPTDGAVADADGGTLVLDEIDRLDITLQLRLAEVLKRGVVRPTGAAHGFRIDVRILAASDRPLSSLVASGEFDGELRAILAGTRIVLPPLRERAGDIPALTRYFLSKIGSQPGMQQHSIADSALALLEAYDWPGNVRQLQAVLFRAAVFCQGESLTADCFPQLSELLGSQDNREAKHQRGLGVMLYTDDGNLRALEDIEADIIRLAIGHYRGRMTEVARRLGIGRSTLYRKLGELGIDSAA